jgi:16S rRNA (guanine966-N2)-methyltransferase
MRVIAGKYKGRNLKTLKGDTTRPTTMRVKESLFSSLISIRGDFDGIVVLDAFAGSGALGIESLSRGATKAVFFERSKQAAQIVKDNLALLQDAHDKALLELGDTARLAMRKRPYAFDLVFFDPPYVYAVQEVFDIIASLDEAGVLNTGALICYELSKKNKEMCAVEAHRVKCELVSMKDFGETTYVILRKGNE